MGLDPDYPAVRINDPAASVPVWNGHHTVIGHLGPADNYHSAAANVTCTIHRWNGGWYKLLNASAWEIPSAAAYVSTGSTHVMEGSPKGYVLGPCPDNTDQPGRSWLWLILAASVLGLLAAAWRVRRVELPPKPGPPGPPREDVRGLE